RGFLEGGTFVPRLRRCIGRRRRGRRRQRDRQASSTHRRQELDRGRPHPRRASGARYTVEGRQGPGQRRARDDLGGEAVRLGQNPPLCPAGHLPLKGGERLAAMPHLILRLWRLEPKRYESVISPLEGEMSGRTEGGGLLGGKRQ